MKKWTLVSYKDPRCRDPYKSKWYKGWNYNRPRVVTMLERHGIVGDVEFHYMLDSDTVRTVRCGI